MAYVRCAAYGRRQATGSAGGRGASYLRRSGLGASYLTRASGPPGYVAGLVPGWRLAG